MFKAIFDNLITWIFNQTKKHTSQKQDNTHLK